MEEPRVVVGLDFGTTFSGFAFAHKTDPQHIHTFYEWPMQAQGRGRPYCKTQTSLYYVPSPDQPSELVLKDWAWPAQVRYLEAMQAACKDHSKAPRAEDWHKEIGHFVTRFKLHLADVSDGAKSGERNKNNATREEPASVRRSGLEKLLPTFIKFGYNSAKSDTASVEKVSVLKSVDKFAGKDNDRNDLPPGVTVERAITDYLQRMTDFVIDHLQKTFGNHLAKRDVQWCLTVPAIWDDAAKQQMRHCAQRAGMVTGRHCPVGLRDSASPFSLTVALESEAASMYCIRKSKQLSLEDGAQFLVADLGGGTVDIVVHVKEKGKDARLRVRQVKQSMGGLCGGAFVDRNFVDFMHRKIGCFVQFVKDNPVASTSLLRKWEDIKCAFDGSSTGSVVFELPRKLTTLWQNQGVQRSGNQLTTIFNYDELEITQEDMLGIFDPVVDQILNILKDQMSSEIQVLMLVGGFSSSPYLMKRVKEEFSHLVKEILCPPDPGGAICQGAVVLGLSPEIIISRVSRKTYGINEYRDFIEGEDPPHLLHMVDGSPKCRDAFCVFLNKGDEVGLHECVQKRRYPVFTNQKSITLKVYSSPQTHPRYTSDPGVQLEASFSIDISDDPSNLETQRCVYISLYFGKAYIEVKAQRDNFGNTSEVLQLSENIEFIHES